MQYIDIHCHLDFPDYQDEFAEVLGRMKDREVGAITIGTDLESSKRAVQIAESCKDVWACVGVHPADNPEKYRENFDEKEFEKLAMNSKYEA
jgi:TatD DNase family protein